MNKIIQFCQLVGLHPLAGVVVFALDVMLFGAESASLGVTWPISIAISAVLTIACALVQKYGIHEQWGLAIGKGLMVGLLTAIPTPLPSIITLAGSGLGAVALLADGRASSEDKNNK